MNATTLVTLTTLAALTLSGCFGSSAPAEFDFEPGTKFKETGRTIHLKASVIDLDQEIYSGLNTWLWAFCFGPFDPNDEVSKAAIIPFTPLPGDKPINAPEGMSCSVPGPTLRVKQGDRVIVEFAHSHFHPHTIHWHGQFVPWQSDGAPGVTQDSVESGSSFTYDFIAKRAGTLWYHCHVDTQMHVQQGLYGMMIVEPQDTTYEPQDVDKEYNLVFSTMRRAIVEAIGTSRHSHPPGCASGFVAPCENPPSQAGKPDVFLVNGHSYPYTMDQPESLIVVKEGERVRLRFLNAGETMETIHLHGHDMLVVGRDGNPFHPLARFYVDTLTIGPAERYDVIVDSNNPGPWMIHTHVASHETNCAKSPGGMHTMFVYDTYMDKMHQFKAEAPAKCPFGSELQLPGDFVNGTKIHLNSGFVPAAPPPAGTVQSANWEWPVELPCAVRKMAFRAFYQTDAVITTGMSLTINIKDTTGAAAGSAITLTPTARSGTFVVEKDGLRTIPAQKGSYTVSASGTVPAGTLELDIVIDYFENFDQTKVAHLTYGTSGCPGYT
jgi:manganese oxidase